jgi:uncharacterized damage-inducible protein DinB
MRTLVDHFAAQLEREAPPTRRALERVPEGKADWKPHAKSMPFGYLASLVATMPGWIAMMLEQDSLDLRPASGPTLSAPDTSTNARLLRAFEESLERGRKALAAADDARLQTRWQLLVTGKVVNEDTRQNVVADTFTHLAHHRGQVSVYLRLLDVPVPSIYGPTADEKTFG